MTVHYGSRRGVAGPRGRLARAEGRRATGPAPPPPELVAVDSWPLTGGQGGGGASVGRVWTDSRDQRITETRSEGKKRKRREQLVGDEKSLTRRRSELSGKPHCYGETKSLEGRYL